MRWSSISLTSLRASSTGCTFDRNARPKTPSKRDSSFDSMVRSTLIRPGSTPAAQCNPGSGSPPPRVGVSSLIGSSASIAAVSHAPPMSGSSGAAGRGERPWPRGTRRRTPAASHGPAAAAVRERDRGGGEDAGLGEQRRMRVEQRCQSAYGDGAAGASLPGDPEPERRRRAVEREARRAAARRRRAASSTAAPAWAARRAGPRASCATSGIRPIAPSGSEQRAGGERAARRARRSTSSATSRTASTANSDREPERDVPEREERGRERERHPGARRERPRARRRRRRARAASRRGRTAASRRPSRPSTRRERRRAATRSRSGVDGELAASAARGGARRRSRLRAALPGPRAQLVGERAPPTGRLAGSSASARADRLVQRGGQVGPDALERLRARPGSGATSRSSSRARNGCRPRERLPEHHADRPDVGRLGRLLAEQPLGRDVGERARARRRVAVSVSNSAICASPKSSRRTSIAASVSASSTFDGFTSRWTIPRPCACASASSTCAATSTALAVADLAGGERLAQRAARGRTRRRCRRGRCRARARRSAGSAGGAARRPRLRLALGARGRLALARDHLQRDVEAAPLVAREPDVAHPSRAQRPQRPVPSEDQLLREGGRGHPPLLLRAEENSFARRTDAVDSATYGPARRRHPVRLLRGRAGDERDGAARACACRGAAARTATAARGRRSGRRAAARRCCGCSALVAIAIVVVLSSALLIQSCAGSSKQRRRTRATWTTSQTIATQSTANGKRARDRADDAGPHGAADRSEAPRHRRSRSSRTCSRAQELDPPGRLRDRERPPRRLARAARQRRSSASPTRSRRRASSKTTDRDRRAALLAAQANRLLASDVVWDDLFRALALRAARRATVSPASPCPSRTSSRTTEL